MLNMKNHLTVNDLILQLQACPPDAPIALICQEGGYEYACVVKTITLALDVNPSDVFCGPHEEISTEFENERYEHFQKVVAVEIGSSE